MNNVKKWTAALRSGDYTQGKTRLYIPAKDDFCSQALHCCLGVAYEVMGEEGSERPNGWRLNAAPRNDLIEWINDVRTGFHANAVVGIALDTDIIMTRHPDGYRNDTHLDYLNDVAGLTFDQIADLIDYFGVKLS